MTVSYVFFVIAAVICLGFAGRWLFTVTRVPDSLLLIAAGVGLRSLLGVDVELAFAAAPYFGGFALLVILFEGGLHLDFRYLLSSWRPALILMISAFVISFTVVFLIANLIFGREPLEAALLAAALGCTSAAIIIPLIREVRVSPQVRTVLELESSLSDAVAVLFVVTALNLIAVPAGEGSNQIGMLVFTSLTGALVIGVGAGFLWMYILRRLAGQPLAYLVTFAGMLIVYAASDAVHSSGVFGAFIFGLTLSNGPVALSKIMTSYDPQPVMDELENSTIKGFHAELTFLVRTFFFVFLGMLFALEQFTPWILFEGAVIYGGILVARYLAVRLSPIPSEAQTKAGGSLALFLFMPRGLASAILATLPATHGLAGTEDFVPITILIILFTNLAMTIGVRFVERREEEAARGAS